MMRANKQGHPKKTFREAIETTTGGPLRATKVDTIQANIGLVCNLACRHCHVQSSPKRKEQMDWATMQQVIGAATSLEASTLDITGGAPEMHPRFRDFVSLGQANSLRLIVRTNLTIMLAEGYRDLPEWFAERSVHLIASLPCYLPNNVDRQRGRDVYGESVRVIQQLNTVGYGRQPEKKLDLVYNPLGASLPPDQTALESAYRRELKREFGIDFNGLHAITNTPIGRFSTDLIHAGEYEDYLRLLRNAYNPATVDHVMCRHQLHVGWDGKLYDCDFNFAVGLAAKLPARHVSEINAQSAREREIAVAEHCYACTAGCGSSCGGALVADEARYPSSVVNTPGGSMEVAR